MTGSMYLILLLSCRNESTRVLRLVSSINYYESICGLNPSLATSTNSPIKLSSSQQLRNLKFAAPESIREHDVSFRSKILLASMRFFLFSLIHLSQKRMDIDGSIRLRMGQAKVVPTRKVAVIDAAAESLVHQRSENKSCRRWSSGKTGRLFSSFWCQDWIGETTLFQ